MPQSTETPRGFRFGVFEVDLRTGELRKDGRKVKLQEQPFQVLAMLLERAGEVVTREEVQKKLWPADTFVDFEHGLNIAINKIREALGDSADSPRFVETLPKRGYRFILPVVALDPSKPAADAATAVPPEVLARTEPARPKSAALRYAVASFGAVAALVAFVVGFNPGGLRDRLRGISSLPQIQSIAVLPLENLSGDPEQEYFADGMTDALITELGQASTLRVISRTSIIPYKGAKKPLPQIARELNVDAIVEGGVLRSGDQVRITAQLIYAPTDQHLWAETYEVNLRDIMLVQRRVAQAIAREIRINLKSREQARRTDGRTLNPQAHEAYLKALYYSGRPAERAKAMEYFNQAIQLDPGYAAPYAGLAASYYIPTFFDAIPPKEGFPRMKEAATQALSRDDTLAEAHGYLALTKLHYDWDWAGAEKEFRRAIELNPNQAGVRHDYAHFLMAMNRGAESLAESERAVDLDPLSLGLAACLGWHRLFGRQYDQSIEQSLRVLQMNPNFVWAQINLAWAYEQRMMFDEAIAQFQTAAKPPGPASTLAMASLGHAYAVSGKRGEAQKVLAQLTERAAKSYVSPYQVAAVYAGLGATNQAFAWLEKAYTERSSWLVHLTWDPRLASLHADPRFTDLVRRIGLPS
ncbi:MAG: hypothetical protein A3H28_02820 [Acidobacteria bacterium RIFCSPLOWO2_02_FULL_61_28]|nr:MAG: hypothetical protein A3H28_02820 [Acidobacteria bacterium RIFCSPLOWO2_02_FULL_61_28]